MNVLLRKCAKVINQNSGAATSGNLLVLEKHPGGWHNIS